MILKSYPPVQDDIAPHPFEGLSFQQMIEQIDALREEYPEFKDLYFELDWASHGYGAMSYWWELKGIE